MLLSALLGIAAAGSAIITTAAITTKEKDKVIQPTTINNINNSFNKSITTTNNTKTNVKNSCTQQSAEIDHNKIIDELYLRYKLDEDMNTLNELMNKLNNL